MKKIIHMSDLHIGFKNLNQQLQKITKNLKIKIGDKSGEYIIVITGDLVENANHQEDYTDVQACIADLKGNGFENILVIPGNHDYGTGSMGDKKFVKIFQEKFYSDQKDYPRLDIIEDVALLGLDSIAQELHWYDSLWSEGELGTQQLNRLKTLLEGDRVRAASKRVIYLHHHPFDARPLHQLKDSKKLQHVLTDIMDKGISIDAIL